MIAASEKLRARARLALRAEKAFGLKALRISLPDNLAQKQAAALPATLAVAAPPPTARIADARKAVIKLFESPATAAPRPPTVPLTGPAYSTDEKRRLLAELDTLQTRICTRCRLHETRTNTVFGEGDPDARIVFIGEGPGENEDLQGRPFIGRAGNLLDKMIAGMGLRREDVFIVNIVKCRPPDNREPAPDEVSACTPILEKQIEIIRPRVIVTLGRPAAQHMLQQKVAISKLRGQWQSWRGIRLMPTFHPAYILRNYTEQTRAAVWSDLQQVMAELGMTIPPKNS